ncbi:DNA polymerase interacting tetratricopeptide repeat-containing, protein of 47 kDa [Anabrus simplex]|uniref:DNA polymerase interacting tetratricopeptide repeat-containing, protein of 47 kDa n=1 Tax=Anabrus simplex TaxID=316456 RepID=UPI0035A39010
MEDQQTSSSSNKKTPLTDEERRELAEKLDEDLDKFIDGLQRRPYTEGWPEDRWREEFEKHPFFMTKSPEVGEELSPLMEGLQQLKYDETDNTPEELAATYKEDGNFSFKYKKYHVAIISYTEGIRQNCKDDALTAQLYNNRAAAHFQLKNYASCLKDCQAALKLLPKYRKAEFRAAQCCYLMGKHDLCMEYCDEMLRETPTDKEAIELRAKAVAAKKVAERNARKEAAAQQKLSAEEKKLLQAIEERGIRIHRSSKGSALALSDLEPHSPYNVHSRVHMMDGRLVWPVVFLYPEYQTTDFIQECHEDSTFESHLEAMFETRPEWDKEDKYKPSNLRVYFEDKLSTKLCAVPAASTIGEALADKRYTVFGGTPAFIVLVADSEIERRFLES